MKCNLELIPAKPSHRLQSVLNPGAVARSAFHPTLRDCFEIANVQNPFFPRKNICSSHLVCASRYPHLGRVRVTALWILITSFNNVLCSTFTGQRADTINIPAAGHRDPADPAADGIKQ